MQLLISAVDALLTVAEPVGAAAAEAGVEDADEFAPLPLELEPQAAAARTASSATTARGGRRGRTTDLRDVSARFMGAPFTTGEAGLIA